MVKVKVCGVVLLLSFCAEENCLLAFRAAELSEAGLDGWGGGELYSSG